MALNREQRRQMLAQELHGTETTVDQVDAVDVVAPPVAPPVAAPAAPEPPAIDPGLIAQIVAATVAAVQSQSAGDVRGQIAQALRDNRKPMPENTDAEYHQRSHWHPPGTVAARPTLQIETWCGSWDHEQGKASPKWRYEDAMLRDDEIETLNALPAGEHLVERKDGKEILLRVVDLRNAMGDIYRRVLCYPKQQFLKEHANQLPDLRDVRRMVLTAA